MRWIEIVNVEIYERCILNISTGEKYFSKNAILKEFTGSYHRDDKNFMALYPTTEGPVIYYGGIEYPIKKNLHIYVKKNGKDREFFINEYNIHICYKESEYLNWDVWSTEIDVDLYWKISQLYKNDGFYKKYTKNVYNLISQEDINKVYKK